MEAGYTSKPLPWINNPQTAAKTIFKGQQTLNSYAEWYYPIATQCDIIDFNQLQDEALSIVLEGRQTVNILSDRQLPNRRGMVRNLNCSNWLPCLLKEDLPLISQAPEQSCEGSGFG